MSLCFPVDLKFWKAGLFIFSVKIVSVSKFYCVNALGSMYILWYFYRLENYMIQNDSGIKYDHKVTPVVAEKMEILTYIWHMACSQIMDLCSLVLSSCMIWFLSRKIIFSNFYCSEHKTKTTCHLCLSFRALFCLSVQVVLNSFGGFHLHIEHRRTELMCHELCRHGSPANSDRAVYKASLQNLAALPVFAAGPCPKFTTHKLHPVVLSVPWRCAGSSMCHHSS